MSQLDGGPAFPDPLRANPNQLAIVGNDGMSLRDWFAGMALQGMIASRLMSVVYNEDNFREWATHAYGLADAMLATQAAQP